MTILFISISRRPWRWLGSDWGSLLVMTRMSVNCSDNVRSFTAGNGRNPAKIPSPADQSEASVQVTWSAAANQRTAFDWPRDTDQAIKHFIKWILIVKRNCIHWTIDPPGDPNARERSIGNEWWSKILISLSSLISWHTRQYEHYSAAAQVSSLSYDRGKLAPGPRWPNQCPDSVIPVYCDTGLWLVKFS